MRKRIISLSIKVVFILSILGSTVFAVEPQKPAPAKPILVEMSLQDAVKYAKEHSSTIRDLKKTYDDYYDTYSDVKDETRDLQNRPNGITIDLDSSSSLGILGVTSYAKTRSDNYCIYKGYALEDAKNTYDDLGKAKEYAEQGIYYGIEKLAYDIEESQKDIQYYNNTKTKLQKDLLITQIMLKLKMVNALQVNKAKNAVSQMDSTIKLMNNALAIKKNALKALLGMDRNTDLKIKTEKVDFKPVGEINIEDIQKQAIANRKDALTALHTLRGKEIDYLVRDYEKNSLAYETYADALKAFDDGKVDYENTINDIKFNVQKIYSALLDSESAYTDSLENFKNVSETNRVDKLKYSNGMISLVELMASNLAYEKAQNDLEKALHDNIIANKRFAASYTIGDLETAAAAQ